MDYLVVSPPVITPAEPPSGAFLLAAALTARGLDAAFLDLSLPFLSDAALAGERAGAARAMRYLRDSLPLDPDRHSSACGELHNAIRRYSEGTDGWRITLMDVSPPIPVHETGALAALVAERGSPFGGVIESLLIPEVERLRPERVLLSVAYLSQLPAALEAASALSRTDSEVMLGGSLPNSLARTGRGADLLREVAPVVTAGDGRDLPGVGGGSPMLGRLAWPEVLGGWDYISPVPVVPFSMTTGCYWDRCLFCPDRGRELTLLGRGPLEGLLESMPVDLRRRRPLLHLVDSAVPPSLLRGSLDILGEWGGWFGFVRPEPALLPLMEQLAGSGCMMLQLGLESGSGRLLSRYCKGLDPEMSERLLVEAAAAGIRTYAYMLSGLPGEGPLDVELTARMLERAGESIDFVNFSVFNLPANCELRRRASEFGIEVLPGEPGEDGALRLYVPFTEEGANPRRRARRSVARLARSSEAVRTALAVTPRWLRPTHLPLFDLPGRRPLRLFAEGHGPQLQ